MPNRRVRDPFAERLGERIRDLRQRKGMSLIELSAKSGVSKGHLSDLEQGNVVMNIGTLDRLARALDVPSFSIVMLPRYEPTAAVIEQVLDMSGGDMKKAAEELRRIAFEIDEQRRRKLLEGS